MPGARGGGPEHSQGDGKAAFWGDPTGLSVMQGNTLQKLLLCSIYVRLPLFSGTNHSSLSGECESSLGVGVLHRISPGPRKAWPSVSIPGTAASLAQQHPRRSSIPGCLGPQAVFAALPPGAASHCLAPWQNLPQKSLFFTGTGAGGGGGNELKRHQPPKAPTATPDCYFDACHVIFTLIS